MENNYINEEKLKTILHSEMSSMELRLSRQINDTYLRMIPIVLTLMGMQLAITLFAVKWTVG